MIRLLDGPGAGENLDLLRAPAMLRVVRNAAGTWDGLDQLSDEAGADEQIWVYRIASKPTVMHLSCRPRSKSRWIISADYRLYPDQPTDATLRDNDAWGRWCSSVESAVRQQLELEGITSE